MQQLKQLSPNTDFTALDEAELLMAHATVHSFYKEIRGGREIEDWEMSDVVQSHDTIRDELDDRDLPHQELNALDEESVDAYQQSMDPTTQAKDWAEEFTSAEQKTDYVVDNPPKADWFIEALQSVNEIDESIDLTDYVTLSHTEYHELGEWVQKWITMMDLETPNEYGAIGYQYNDETDAGVGLLKNLSQSDEPYVIISRQEIIERTDDIAYAYQSASELMEKVEDGELIHQEEDDDDPEDVLQGTVIGTDREYDWYVWERDEIETWLQEHNFQVGEPSEKDGYLIYEQRGDELYDTFYEWRGPMFHSPSLIPQVDGRPKLFILGYPNEEFSVYEDAVVQGVAFRYEEPVDGFEIEQMEVLESDLDFYWYQWDKAETDLWVEERDLEATSVDTSGSFHEYVIRDADEFDSVQTVWEGKRARPDEDELDAAQKPRRVTYGVDEDGEKEIQSIEFLTSPTKEQMARAFLRDKVDETVSQKFRSVIGEVEEDE